MRFTRKEDLTFFLMSKLAQNYGEGLISLSEIANEFNISTFFLKHLVRPLVKANLLVSKEGIKGGYALSKKPSEITLYEIFSALSSLPKLTVCCRRKSEGNCSLVPFCKPRSVWKKINQNILGQLNKIKLSQIT